MGAQAALSHRHSGGHAGGDHLALFGVRAGDSGGTYAMAGIVLHILRVFRHRTVARTA